MPKAANPSLVFIICSDGVILCEKNKIDVANARFYGSISYIKDFKTKGIVSWIKQQILH